MKKYILNIVAISLFSPITFAQIAPGSDPNEDQYKNTGSKVEAGVAKVGCLECIKNQSQVAIDRNTNPQQSKGSTHESDKAKGAQ